MPNRKYHKNNEPSSRAFGLLLVLILFVAVIVLMLTGEGNLTSADPPASLGQPAAPPPQ